MSSPLEQAPRRDSQGNIDYAFYLDRGREARAQQAWQLLATVLKQIKGLRATVADKTTGVKHSRCVAKG